jgi:hypothetical protein
MAISPIVFCQKTGYSLYINFNTTLSCGWGRQGEIADSAISSMI